MYSVGIDLIEIARLKRSSNSENFMKRVFSKKEKALFLSKFNPYPSMAGNWAGKEAFSKALGTGVRDFSLNEVSVLRDELGKPYIELYGKALEIAQSRNLQFSISITHTKELAEAVVIAYERG